MATATPCIDQQTACTPTLLLAFELGETHGSSVAPRGQRSGPANGRWLQASARRCWRRFAGPSNALACPTTHGVSVATRRAARGCGSIGVEDGMA